MRLRVPFWLGLYLILSLSSQVYAQSTECFLVGYTDCETIGKCHQFSIFEPNGENFIEKQTIPESEGFEFRILAGYGAQGYTISPDNQHIVITESIVADSLPLEGYLLLQMLDLSQAQIEPQLIAIDVLLAYGGVWSSDSSKLLLLSSNGQWELQMYDLKTEDHLWLHSAEPFSSIEAVQVAWSPSNDLIAVVGADSMFGANNPTVLWMTKTLPDGYTANYTPISDPTREVNSQFTWVSDDEIAYTTYQYNRENNQREMPQLLISSVDGDSKFVLDGDFSIVGMRSKDHLLMLHNGDFVDLDLKTYKLTALTSDANINSIYALSPDRSHVSYVSDGQLIIQSLFDESRQLLNASMENDAGLWHPNGKLLYLFDHGQNIVRIYDVENQNVRQSSASDVFLGQQTLPYYPTWVCP